MAYGKELIIDLYDCDVHKFNRQDISIYMKEMCKLLDMNRSDLHFWDDLDVPKEERETEPHLKGTSAVQFITTSTITIHTLDLLGEVYVNIFSCKEFNAMRAITFTQFFFRGNYQRGHGPSGGRLVMRGMDSGV